MYQTTSSSSRKKRSTAWRSGSFPWRRNPVPYDIYNFPYDIFNLIRPPIKRNKKLPEYLQDDPNIAKVKTCDLQTSRDESEVCLNRDNGSQNLDTVCKTTNSTCSRKLRCNRRNKKWHCQQGQHVYTDLVCCDLKCKELLPQHVVQNIDPLY